MDTKALRQKILDLAIRGKLVPQDPNDEPASVLLERIREQKKQMVKEGKLKAKDIKNDTIIFRGEDNLHYEKFQDGSVKCIEDEIPFELPEGWEWCRLKSLAAPHENSFVDGPFGSNLKTEHYTEKKEVRIIQLNNIGELEWKNNGVKYTTFSHAETLKRCKSYPGDIVIAKMMPAGRAVIIPDINDIYVISSDCVRLQLPPYIDSNYIMYMINSTTINSSILETVQGIGRSRTSLSKLKEILVPLPGYIEQQKITEKIINLLIDVAVIDDNITDILDFVRMTKNKILDLAIRGKLVPQDPNDEPASVLLERIHEEKEELIKQGKIKRDKKESFIFRGDDNSYYEKIGNEVRCIDEEIPFEIPDTWEWVRLKNCCCKEIRRGKSPKYIEQSETLVFAQKCNTKYNGIDIGLALYLDESTLNKYPEDEYMQDEDIVINSTGTGTLGRVGFYRSTANRNNIPIVPDSHVTVIRSYRELHAFYLYAFMKANQSELEKKGEGSTNQKELKPLTLKELYVPIPPYEEQLRIAVSINNAFSLISKLEKSLK